MVIAIFVDMQNDFIHGVLGTPEAQAIVSYVMEQSHNKKFDVAIFTQDWHDTQFHKNTIESQRIPAHTIANSFGADIIEGLIPRGEMTWVAYQKHSFGFYSLPDALMDEACGYGEDITEIHLMGVCTDICVISNALILRSAFPSVPIYVHAKGCAGTTPENHEAALKVMRSCLIDVI